MSATMVVWTFFLSQDSEAATFIWHWSEDELSHGYRDNQDMSGYPWKHTLLIHSAPSSSPGCLYCATIEYKCDATYNMYMTHKDPIDQGPAFTAPHSHAIFCMHIFKNVFQDFGFSKVWYC